MYVGVRSVVVTGFLRDGAAAVGRLRATLVSVVVLLSLLGLACSTSGDRRDSNGLATVCLPRVPDSDEALCIDRYESGVVDVRAAGLLANSPVEVANDRGESASLRAIADGTLTDELTDIEADRPLLVRATWGDGSPAILSTN